MEHDAIVVGGGFAGLAAATYLARSRLNVRVIDTGQPRNRSATSLHGFLAQDGSDPHQVLATARAQLLAYPTVQWTEAEATVAHARDAGFSVLLASGEELEAHKLILAFGVRDVLPDVPGLEERWGQTVLHCPYCHGFEFSDRQLGVLYHSPMSVQRAYQIAGWGPTTLYLNGAQLGADDAAKLAARNVKVEQARVMALVGDGPLLSAVELEDGRRTAIAALFVSPPHRLASPLPEQLDIEIEEGPSGPLVRTDTDQMTTLSGVYAAGDIAKWPHNVSWAVADGVTAAIAVHRALVFG